MSSRRYKRAFKPRRSNRRWACVGALLLAIYPICVSAEIPWRNSLGSTAANQPATTADVIAEARAGGEPSHIAVQFDAPLTPDVREDLRRAGITLQRYLGDHAYFATVSGLSQATAAAPPALTRAWAIQREWKLDPLISDGTLPDWAITEKLPGTEPIVGVYVLFHPDVTLDVDAVNAVAQRGGVVRDTLESVNGLVVELPLSEINALADEDAVQWIEWPLPPMSETNDSNSAITEANDVQAAPYNLDGSGITVLVYDGGTVRSTHVDFEGRLTVHDSSGMADHATHVACTVGGGGVQSATYEGMAPGTTMLSYGFEYDGSGTFLYTNPGDLESDYTEAINTRGADISNNSIGTNTEPNGFDCAFQGNYGATSALIDAIVGGSLGSPFRVVWANGNERQGSRCDVEGYGDYYSTAPPAGAKNHIAIGALNSNNDSMTSFSSWGPLDDGRLKPDVSGPGCQSTGDGGVTSCSSSGNTAYTVKCGTSMAAPTVTGLAALLLEDFRAQFPTRPDFRNSTLKTLLAHNAVDILNTGPDYQSGYGSVRIKQTVDFMRTDNFLEDQVDQGGVISVLVVVSPGDPELKVTLAWDDVPGTPNVNPALVNDLDLRVFDPSSTQHYPWTLNPTSPSTAAVQTQADHINNIEQVLVNSPAAGTWRVEVYGFNVPDGPQSYSLCASPLMVACSSQGTVTLDATSYGCSSTAGIQVIDCDLDTNSNVVETVTVTLDSTSEPGGESVLLTETAADTADFQGSIALSTTNSAGVLQVAHGDTVTATYNDADDGQGGTNVTVTDTANVNCAGPLISNVQTTNIGADTATVTFDTDTTATGTIRYGASCGSLTGSQLEASSGTAHSIPLTGLTSGTLYYYAVDAEDLQANTSTDDNGGSCYAFTTLTIAHDFPMDTDPGWTTAGQWAHGQPTGGGGQHGGADPTSGYTGNNVYGYNLSGDYANSLSETNLTTPALDCTGLTNVKLTFQRWIGVEQPLYDHAYVRVSNNGSTWTDLWENTAEVADTAWSFQEFDISAVADNQSTVYLRWTMGTTDSSWQYCGWNIDDVQVVGASAATCSDGILNQGETRIDCGGPCPACQCTADGQCADSLFCNGTETCDAFGACQSGTAVNCDDAIGCTDDSCNETTDACDNVTNDANCDNAQWCDGTETCNATLDCQTGTAPNCDDAIGCTDDSCNETTDSCDNVTNDANCDNTQWCDGAETCSATLDCQAGTAVSCDDGVACTDDSCNETTESCDNITNDANCDNAQWCDGTETCSATLDCQAGTAVNCDDGIACTDDTCNETTDSCDNIANDANCDNAVWCDGTETCSATLDCQAGAAPCVDACEHCTEATDTCDWCIFDLDGNSAMGTGDFSLFAACFGDCYAPADPCAASNFDDDPGDCVGTGDYAAFVGCFGLTCGGCANCSGPGGGAGSVASETTTATTVQLVATAQPTRDDLVDALPVSVTTWTVDQPLYIEVWAALSPETASSTGLAAVYVDLLTEPNSLTVEQLLPSDALATLAGGSIEQKTGSARAIGGCAALDDDTVGLSSTWVRVATLRTRAETPGRVVISTAPAGAPYGIALFGTFGDLEPSRIEFGQISLTIQSKAKLGRRQQRVPATLRP